MEKDNNGVSNLSMPYLDDISYFEHLYKDNLYVLCLIAFKLLGDKDRANDCVQDLFLELWDKDKTSYLRTLDEVGAYLCTCVRNKCYRILTLEHKKNRDIKEFYVTRSVESMVEKEIIHEEFLLTDIFRNMPPQPYKALHLHVVEGKRRSEVAQLLGVSVNTIKTHLKIAFKIARRNIIKDSK